MGPHRAGAPLGGTHDQHGVVPGGSVVASEGGWEEGGRGAMKTQDSLELV